MHDQPSPIRFPRNAQPVHWIIAGLLAVIAAGLWLRPDGSLLPSALAQNPPMAGARGVFAFTGQIDHSRFGLFMLDVDQGTLWCYELETAGGTRKLRLIAARTWLYDRYLQDFNCAAPDFRTVRQLVEQQRTRTADEAEPGAADANPPPAAPADDGTRSDD